MAVQIKLFQSFQKFNQILGIHPSQPDQSYSFKPRSAAVLLFLISPFISCTTHFVFKAETLAEYAQSFIMSTTGLCISIDFVSMCLEMRNILQLIENYEGFIEKSK